MPFKRQDGPRASHELPDPASRIGYSMIKGAEDAGQIQPGKTTLVEPTSGQSSLWPLQGIFMFDKPEVGLLEAHEH